MASCSSPRRATFDLSSPTLTIIYATEMGKAQDYAGRVAHYCRRAHFKCRVFDVDKYPLVRAQARIDIQRHLANLPSLKLYQRVSLYTSHLPLVREESPGR